MALELLTGIDRVLLQLAVVSDIVEWQRPLISLELGSSSLVESLLLHTETERIFVVLLVDGESSSAQSLGVMHLHLVSLDRVL